MQTANRRTGPCNPADFLGLSRRTVNDGCHHAGHGQPRLAPRGPFRSGTRGPSRPRGRRAHHARTAASALRPWRALERAGTPRLGEQGRAHALAALSG
ncbi:Hypothetical protein CAP_3671 [Chondromyces apiculatus DSM 436]|uniref:Uncharacterized protein n=1 Tax=Chondromyces apiculatus DSM 436 TaxID=1192034 RepID=A0A017T926_9BACT|nr:Hypothetical protein CAP_3671 [Chondromyces apiculatus DSM 436]